MMVSEMPDIWGYVGGSDPFSPYDHPCFIHCYSYFKVMAAQRRTLAVGARDDTEISCPALPSLSASLGLWEDVKKEENTEL